MTKKEFFNLDISKKTINILRNECITRFCSEDVDVIATNWFFNEVATQIKEYIYLPKAVKAITKKPSTEGIYNKYVEIKALGYRKELTLPF